MLSNQRMEAITKKTETLIEALPYIQKFAGKTVVIKYGGNAMINEDLKNLVMQDITLLKYIGLNPVIVHGGGPDINRALKSFHIDSEFINGLRVTDEETMKVAQMVLVGKTNKEIVSLLNQNGIKAIGFCGIDGRIIECEKYMPDSDNGKIDIGYVGKTTRINTKLIEMICRDEFIPVIAPIGVGADGHSYNINADTAAGDIAAALGAEKLMLLTDVEGVKDGSDGDDIISTLNISEVQAMIDSGIISGGMIPKVVSCMEAINKGVKKVHILDGRVPHCLLLEIFTNHGIGTQILK